jgi:hypothetical protein
MTVVSRHPTGMLPNSDVAADKALSRCAPSGPCSLTPVVGQTARLKALICEVWVRMEGDTEWVRQCARCAEASQKRHAPSPRGARSTKAFRQRGGSERRAWGRSSSALLQGVVPRQRRPFLTGSLPMAG